MRETTTGVASKAAPDAPRAPDEREPANPPLSQTGRAKTLMAKSRTVRVWASSSPPFKLLLFGSSISMLGTRISTVAFPMLVLHLYNSPFVTGLVAFAAIAPSMLIYIPAGVLVDRWNPRRVMFISELSRGAVIASVVVTLAIFRAHVFIWFLILAMLTEEILEIFSVLADRRYLNRVIERDKIASQQASIEVRTHAAVLAGRPVGPFLFSIAPYLPFLADAISFMASMTSLLLIGKDSEPQAELPRLALRQIISDIRQGFRWLFHDRRALVTISLMAVTSMVAQALILMFLVEAHSRQLSTLAIGIVLAASGAGGAVGSFCSKFVPDLWRRFWLSIQMVVWSLALTSLALAGGQSVYCNAGAMFILGLTGAIGNIEFGTYLVRNVADDMIAKVTGIGQMMAIGACALGPVFGGAAIQRFQVRGAILILLAIVLLMVLLSFLQLGKSGQVAGNFRGGAQIFRGGAHDAVVGNDRISPQKEISRLSSSIDFMAVTCEDASPLVSASGLSCCQHTVLPSVSGRVRRIPEALESADLTGLDSFAERR